MLELIKKRVDTALNRFADETHAEDPQFAKFANTVFAFVLRPGGRLRSSLCLLAGEAFGCKNATALDRLAVGLELLHAMALMHDDVIDRAQERRGEPTLNHVFESMGHTSAGNDLAMLAGDWLLTRALGMIADAGFEAERQARILRLALRKSEDAAAGAAREILLTGVSPAEFDKADIVEIYRLKTAEYSVVCPLVAGGLAGRVEQASLLEALTRIGSALGIAYQMNDDLTELRTAQNEDVARRRPTILLWYAWHLLSDHEKAWIDQYLAMPDPNAETRGHVARLVASDSVVETVRRDIDDYCNLAITTMKSAALPEPLACGLLAIAEKLQART